MNYKVYMDAFKAGVAFYEYWKKQSVNGTLAKDSDEWITVNGAHVMIDSENGDVKAGAGGNLQSGNVSKSDSIKGNTSTLSTADNVLKNNKDSVLNKMTVEELDGEKSGIKASLENIYKVSAKYSENDPIQKELSNRAQALESMSGKIDKITERKVQENRQKNGTTKEETPAERANRTEQGLMDLFGYPPANFRK